MIAMADRLPLLRGRITSEEAYGSPQRGGSPPKLPRRDPNAHRAQIERQLDAIEKQIGDRTPSSRDSLAAREIIAVRPLEGTQLAAKSLSDQNSDARLVGEISETGTVILDVKDSRLQYLRKKLNDFADDTKKHRNKSAIAPMESIGLASIDDVSGSRLRPSEFKVSQPYWFEVACRGGYRRPENEAQQSREQLSRQLQCLGILQDIEEFLAAELIYFYLRLTLDELKNLQAATDCIYEVDLAPPPIRDLKLFDKVMTADIRDFTLAPPAERAPSVVILDTGISTGHPLLQAAILTATTAGKLIPSPEDTHGHGTKMAGVILYEDLGGAIEHGSATSPFWIQSSRLLAYPGKGTASDENYEKWPILTQDAITSAETTDVSRRNRAFVLAVTQTMQEPPFDSQEPPFDSQEPPFDSQEPPFDSLVPTLWSHAADQIAFNEGEGRLLIISAGNAREDRWRTLAEQYPQLQLSEKIHQPGQAANVVTVGAYTQRCELPRSEEYNEGKVVALSPGGISPFSSTGLKGKWPIKPDVVEEGGNLAIVSDLPDFSVPTLSGLTTSHRHTLRAPLGLLSMTSEAAARVGRLAASIWLVEPGLRPATVRALIVHSANWTPQMAEQFSGVRERLRACGYGVPDADMARGCASRRATIVIEDFVSNAIAHEEPKKPSPKLPNTKKTETKYKRQMKLYRVPIPDELLGQDDPDVELRVSLSYFAEPNTFGRQIFYGLDLKWDMQGPQESEDDFLQRINKFRRSKSSEERHDKHIKKKSFDWDVGIQARSRGTVQSDRWRGKMSEIVGDKLIAIIPVLGWWDQRKDLKTQRMDFSLVVSIFGPGVYDAIKPWVEGAASGTVEV